MIAVLAALVWKELLALRRDAHGLAALFLMPVLFVVVMSLALRDVYEPPLRSLRHALDLRDTGPGAREFAALWAAGHGAAERLSPDAWPQLRRGELKYLIVVDDGFSEELRLLAMPMLPRLHLHTEPGMDANLFNALRAELQAVAGQMKARGALQTLGEPVAATASEQKLVSAERHAAGGPRPSSVQQNVAAWLVFGMFFVIAALANLFVEERRSGALARLAGLGVPPAVQLASKFVPYFGVNLVQAGLMLAVGVWLLPLLGGDALGLARVDGPALAAVVCATAAAAVSLALMLSCLVRTPAQAAAVGPVLNVLMAAVGGIMVPTFVMPRFMQQMAALSPMNWGLEGLLDVLLRGGSLASASPQMLKLLLFAAAMLALAWALFTRKTA